MIKRIKYVRNSKQRIYLAFEYNFVIYLIIYYIYSYITLEILAILHTDPDRM